MKKLALLLVIIQGLLAGTASAQAYCALRDPVSRIYDVFPDANAFRSYVGTIDEVTREEIAERLPFTLHFNELGRHTLYTPTLNGVPVGFAHVRSERGNWGLIEVLWGFDFEMRVTGYVFQRCRSRLRKTVEGEPFASLIIGKNFNEIRALLSKDGNSLREGILPPHVDPGMAMALIRCALKTIAATEAAWKDEVNFCMAQSRAFSWLGPGVRVTSLQGKISRKAPQEINPIVIAENRVDLTNTVVFRLRPGDKGVDALMLRSDTHLGDYPLTLWWLFEGGRLTKVACQTGWPREDLKSSFYTAIDQQRAWDECSTPVELLTSAVYNCMHGLSSE